MPKFKVGDFKKSPLKNFLVHLNCSEFFPRYAPGVDNWKNKLRGYSSRGKPLDFSQNDIVEILSGLKKFERDLFLFSVENHK
jgi:hypothetical protein